MTKYEYYVPEWKATAEEMELRAACRGCVHWNHNAKCCNYLDDTGRLRSRIIIGPDGRKTVERLKPGVRCEHYEKGKRRRIIKTLGLPSGKRRETHD